MPEETTENYKYSKAHLKQILELFKDNNNYDELLIALFSDSKIDNKTFAKLKKLRSDIITTVDGLIKNLSGNKSIESKALTDLLTQFHGLGNDAQYDKDVLADNEKALTKKLKKMVKVTDKLLTIVPFDKPGSQSEKMLNSEETDPKFKENVTKFVANNTYAKIYISKGKYEPTEFEKTQICKYEKSKEYKPIDYTTLDPRTIESELRSSYQYFTGKEENGVKTEGHDFVVNSNRTSLLKKFGLTPLNWIGSGLVATGAVAVASVIMLTTMPFDGGTIQSVGTFSLNNLLLFGSSLSITGAISIANQYRSNKKFNKKVRHEISKLTLEQKKTFLNLVRNNNIFHIRKVRKACKENGIPTNLSKRLNIFNYRFIRRQAKRKLRFGAKLVDKWVFDRIVNEDVTNLTSKEKNDINLNSSTLSLKYNKSNPLGKIFGIEGTKGVKTAAAGKEKGKQGKTGSNEGTGDEGQTKTDVNEENVQGQVDKNIPDDSYVQVQVDEIITDHSKDEIDRLKKDIKKVKARGDTYFITFTEKAQKIRPEILGAEIAVNKENTKVKSKLFRKIVKSIASAVDNADLVNDIEDILENIVGTGKTHERKTGNDEGTIEVIVTPILKDDDPPKR